MEGEGKRPTPVCGGIDVAKETLDITATMVLSFHDQRRGDTLWCFRMDTGFVRSTRSPDGRCSDRFGGPTGLSGNAR